MRDLANRILFLAGTTLLAAAVIYGAPSTPAWPDPTHGRVSVRVASAVDLLAVVAPVRAALKRKSAHHTDTVEPNGASCPDTMPLSPPSSDAPVPMPNGKVASPCPAAGSDAQSDIARGPALATPEPLNSKQLIAPRAKTPG